VTLVEVLLDTHAAIWWADDPSLLSPHAEAILADPRNVVWFSAASAWELSIKVRSGKLSLDLERLVKQLTQHGVRLLGIGIDDGIAAGMLDWTHRDPFDRMLVAQANRQDLHLLTRDAMVAEYLGDRAIEV
jgi:PIN domain nuclease of toxin-antitoxin system